MRPPFYLRVLVKLSIFASGIGTLVLISQLVLPEKWVWLSVDQQLGLVFVAILFMIYVIALITVWVEEKGDKDG